MASSGQPNAITVGGNSHLVLYPLMQRPLVAMSQDGVAMGTEETSVQTQRVAPHLSHPHLVNNRSKSKQSSLTITIWGEGGRIKNKIHNNLTCLICFTFFLLLAFRTCPWPSINACLLVEHHLTTSLNSKFQLVRHFCMEQSSQTEHSLAA